MGHAGLSIGVGASEGGIGGGITGGGVVGAIAGGGVFSPAGFAIGAAVGAALGAGFSAAAYVLSQGQSTSAIPPNRNAVAPGSLRERAVPVAFGRCRATSPCPIDVGAWWWRGPFINTNTGPNIRVMNAFFALAEGTIQFAGNYRVDGRPLELIAGAESTASGGSDTGAPCKLARLTLFNGTPTQGLSPRLLDAAPPLVGAPTLTHSSGTGSIANGTYSIAYAYYGGGTESFPSVLSPTANGLPAGDYGGSTAQSHDNSARLLPGKARPA